MYHPYMEHDDCTCTEAFVSYLVLNVFAYECDDRVTHTVQLASVGLLAQACLTYYYDTVHICMKL